MPMPTERNYWVANRPDDFSRSRFWSRGRGLGDAAPDAVTQAINDAISQFSVHAASINRQLENAYSMMVLAGGTFLYDASYVLPTMRNVIDRIRGIEQIIVAGAVDRIDEYDRAAKAAIQFMRDYVGESFLTYLPTVMEELDIIAGIPRMLADAIISTAQVTGKTANELAKNAGLDPAKLPGIGTDLLTKVIIGGVILGAFYLWMNRRPQPAR